MWLRASLVALLLPALALGQGKKDRPGWRAEAKKRLTPAQVKVLASQGFVVGDETCKQVFTPYIHSDLPVFVTSDSLLNAFHVLLEESVYRLERVNAARLPAFLEYTVGRLDKAAEGVSDKPALLRAAKRRARVFLGTALRLHKEGAGTFDDATSKLIAAEVARVTAARAVTKPEWLGPRDRGFVALDYSRFRPRGFYTRTPELQRYFRAVSWLQAIPFRVEKDEELLAAFLLSRAAVVPDDPKREAVWQGAAVLDSFREFLGSGDDWGLGVFNWFDRTAKEPPTVEILRANLMKEARADSRPRINDHLAFLPDDPKAVAEVSIRMAPARRLPDAVLFQRITDPRHHLKRKWPGGLDLAAALGSAHARRQLGKADGKELLALLDANKGLLVGTHGPRDEGAGPPLSTSSLYTQYLASLGTLLATSEPDWPAFMKGDPWQAKTCQTALAGWAQMRHTWVLQAKLQITYLSALPRPSGFVEPVPEFYRVFGRLCKRMETVLGRAGAFADDHRAGPRDVDELYAQQRIAGEVLAFERVIDILERADVVKRGAEAYRRLSEEDRKEVRVLTKRLDQRDPGGLEKPEQFRAYLDGLWKGRAKSAHKLAGSDVPLGFRWEALRECCTRLEILSHKQLRGRPFALEEKGFLTGYGKLLAELMFYDGESYVNPRDDAPRVVDVFAGGGKFLEVGIARPRPIYVLYPWQGKEVLCRGAILPYHEWIHGERLTDEAWRRLLKTPDRPPQPAWTRVLTEGAGR
jgi:hypothetical protein